MADSQFLKACKWYDTRSEWEQRHIKTMVYQFGVLGISFDLALTQVYSMMKGEGE